MTTLQPAPRPIDGINLGVDPGPRIADGVVERVVELLLRRPEPRPASRPEALERPAPASVIDLRVSRVRARGAYDRLCAARLDDAHALASAWDELTTIERDSRRTAASSG